jgi:large subunit ribosomal protein L25
MELTLHVIKRDIIGRKNHSLRKKGQVPGIIYGGKELPTMISVREQDFIHVYKQAGESTLVQLEVDQAKTEAVLIQAFQRDSLHDQIIHVDFRRIDLLKPLEVDVQLHFIGEAPAVRELGGTLVSNRHTVQVRALPKNLIKTLEVDLSLLKTFDDMIRLSDLSYPEGIELLDEPESSVASVIPPRSDEEIKKLDEAVQEDVNQIERVGKKEKTEEEVATEEKAVPEAKTQEKKK